MIHLTIEKFRDALQKGLGRAVIQVREQGQDNLGDDILHACLHNLTYDPQCEGDRANWMLEIVELTEEQELYHQRILEALPDATDFWDAQQLVELATTLARRGSPHARRAIYDKFELQEFNESWLGGCQIVELDGIEGLLRVAEVIGARLIKDRGYWEDDYLVSEASDRLGFETVMASLEERAAASANVRAYKDAVTEHKDAVTEHRAVGADKDGITNRTNRQSRPTIKHILSKIEAAAGSVFGSYSYSYFGSHASAEEIEHLFSRLLAETRREQLIRYLWIFRQRALPVLDQRLFDLAETDDEDLQDAAIAAFANTRDISVRDLAIRLLQQPTSIYRGAIKLFIKNYEPGDCHLIESVLYVSENTDMWHAIGRDLVDLIEAQKDPDLASCCLWIYEHTPCSLCRESAVKALIERERATKTLLSECLWDCSKDIRAMAKFPHSLKSGLSRSASSQ